MMPVINSVTKYDGYSRAFSDVMAYCVIK